MKLRSLAPLLALIPVVAFAAVVGQTQPPIAAAEAGPMQGADSPASVPTNTATSPTSYAEYRNAEWRFLLDVPDDWSADSYPERGGVTVQFNDVSGAYQFEVSAWPYSDLDIALGEEAPAGTAADEPDTLGIVRVYRDDMFEMTFVKNGISYNVRTLPEDGTTTLNILKSWQFI
jgi:hypothetical protein